MCTSFLIACLVIYWNNLNIRFWICDDREARKHSDSRRTLSCPAAHAAEFICKHMQTYMPIGSNRWAVYAICSQPMRYGKPVPLLLRTWHDLTHPDTSCCDPYNPWSADSNVIQCARDGPTTRTLAARVFPHSERWHRPLGSVTRCHEASSKRAGRGKCKAYLLLRTRTKPGIWHQIWMIWMPSNALQQKPFAWFPLAETSWHQLQQ